MKGSGDTISGNDGDDQLDGGDGNDTLIGGAGADKLSGGGGIDTADYSASGAAVTINLATGAASGGDAQGDQLNSIENLIGSKYNDVLTGSSAGNTIRGGDGNDTVDGGDGTDYVYGDAGDDVITGGAGDDFEYGGAGNDTFLVEWANAGDTYDGGDGIDTFNADVAVLNQYIQEIDLATGTNNWGDHFANIENIVGSAMNDKFWGTEGANVFNGRNGDDLLDGRGGNDDLSGEAGNDTLIGGAGADKLSGGDGNDTADYSTSTVTGVNVNLATGAASGGDAQGDTLSSIENLTGSKFNDVLTGNTGANVLNGGAGDDLLVGGAGADRLIGGDGSDTADYSASGAALTVNLATGAAFGGDADGDTLSGIENVTGTKFNDSLTGDANANTLNGGAGNDILVGGAGADRLIGGDGVDTADYSASGAGVTVNLLAGTGAGGDADGDVLSGIENLVGSAYNDVLTGDALANRIDAGKGDDVVFGSGGGDTILGGDGTDLVDYSNSTAAVTVSLVTGAGAGGFAQGDMLSGIENLTGSKYNDVLTGDDAANVLSGGAGNDMLSGGAGADTLNGGDGNDVLTGGLGADALNGGDGIDTIDYSASSAAVTVDLMRAILSGGDAEGDTVSGIENITGSAFDDTLTGDTTSNTILAGAGDDRIYGSSGGDTLNGGDGIDTVDYSNSDDNVAVDLTLGTGKGGYAQSDKLSNIENLIGSAFNDTLIGTAGANVINGGAGDDVLRGGAGADTLIGGDGIDLADYSTSSAGVYVNLATGEVHGGDAEGDVLIGIENLRGSAFDDVLIGSADTTLLDGGGGNDILDYSLSTAGVNVNIETNVAFGGYAEGDTISNFENLRGSAAADSLTGNLGGNYIDAGDGDDNVDGGAGNDTILGGLGNDNLKGGDGNDNISGGAGNDRLTGGLGADVLNGGDGSDTADYRKALSGVVASLLSGKGTGGEAAGDTFISIENLQGSAFDDTLTGDNNTNRINGMSGADKIYGMGGNDWIITGGGYDTIDGGDGVDTVSYEDSWDMVLVNLATNVNKYGAASRDIITNVENVMGSDYNDDITGNDVANRLNGGLGNDTLSGGKGNDYLLGGEGNDTMTGGADADVFVFENSFGNDVITDFWAGAGRTDRVWLKDAGITSLADVHYTLTDTAAGAVLAIDGHGSITFTGVHAAQLVLDDFIFN
ncbi:MAG: calcium-binding protein [Hyphomicrobiales bacterium]